MTARRRASSSPAQSPSSRRCVPGSASASSTTSSRAASRTSRPYCPNDARARAIGSSPTRTRAGLGRIRAVAEHLAKSVARDRGMFYVSIVPLPLRERGLGVRVRAREARWRAPDPSSGPSATFSRRGAQEEKRAPLAPPLERTQPVERDTRVPRNDEDHPPLRRDRLYRKTHRARGAREARASCSRAETPKR